MVTDRMAREAVNEYLKEAFTRVDLDATLAQAEREAMEGDQAEARRGLEAGLAEVRLKRRNLVDSVEAGAMRMDDVRERRQEHDATETRLLGRLAKLDAGDGTKTEAARLAQHLRGRTMEGVVALGEQEPARYRQFLGWFFERVVLDGSGRGRGRAVRVAAVGFTEAGALFLEPPLVGVPQMQNAQEWDAQGAPWVTPLALLLPVSATTT